MNELRTKEIGLASFMQIKGCQLTGFENNFFVFESAEGKSISDWEIEYANSCCSKHDDAVMRLRKFKNKN
jgi:hypothetical protein